MNFPKRAVSILCMLALMSCTFGAVTFAQNGETEEELAQMTVIDDCNNFSKLAMMHEIRFVGVYDPAARGTAAIFDSGDKMLTNSRDTAAAYPVKYIWPVLSETKFAIVAYYKAELIENETAVKAGKALTFATSRDRVSTEWAAATARAEVLGKTSGGDYYKVAFIIDTTKRYDRFVRVSYPSTNQFELLITKVLTQGGADESADDYVLKLHDTGRDASKFSASAGSYQYVIKAVSENGYLPGDLDLMFPVSAANSANSKLTWEIGGTGKARAVVKVRYAYSYWKTDAYGIHIPGSLKDGSDALLAPKFEYSADGVNFTELSADKEYWEPAYGIKATPAAAPLADLLVNTAIYRQSYDICSFTIEDIPKTANYFRYTFPAKYTTNTDVALTDVKLYRRSDTPEPNPGVEQELDDMQVLDNCNNFSKAAMLHELRFISLYNPLQHDTEAHFAAGDVMITNSRDAHGNYPVACVWNIKSAAKVAVLAYYHKSLIEDAQRVVPGKELIFSTSEDRVSTGWAPETPDVYVLEKMPSGEYYRVAFLFDETARYGRYFKTVFPATNAREIFITQVRTSGGTDEEKDDFVLVKRDTCGNFTAVDSTQGGLTVGKSAASANGYNVGDLELIYASSGGTNQKISMTWKYAGSGTGKAVVKLRYVYSYWKKDSYGIHIPGQLADGSPHKLEPRFQYSENGTDFHDLTIAGRYWEPTYGISDTIQPNQLGDLLVNPALGGPSYDMCSFTLENIPDGSKYFRFWFPESYTNAWDVAISDVKIYTEEEYTEPPAPQPSPDPQTVAEIAAMPVIDDCNNFSKAAMMHELRFAGVYDPARFGTEAFFDPGDVMLTNSRDVAGNYPVTYVWDIKSETKAAVIAYYHKDSIVNAESVAPGKTLSFASSEDRASADWIVETPAVHVLELIPGSDYYKVAFLFHKTEKYSRYLKVVYPATAKNEILITQVKAQGGTDEANPLYPFVFHEPCADIDNANIVDSNGTFANEKDAASGNGNNVGDLDRYSSYPANGGADVFLTWALGGSGEGKAVVKLRYSYIYWKLDGYGIHIPGTMKDEMIGLYDLDPIFYASEDGEEFIPLSINKRYWEPTYGISQTPKDTYMADLLVNENLFRQSYDMCYFTVEGIPEEARFFKMVFPPIYANPWDVRLSDMKIYRTSATDLPAIADGGLDLGIVDHEDEGEDFRLVLDDPDGKQLEAEPENNAGTGDARGTFMTAAAALVPAVAALIVLTFPAREKRRRRRRALRMKPGR